KPSNLARKRKCDFPRSGVWWPRGRTPRGLAARGTRPFATRVARIGTSPESRGSPAGRSEEAAWRGATVTAKDEGSTLLAGDEQGSPFSDVEELQALVADG